MTVSKKMGKSRAKGNGLSFKVTHLLGANTMGPLVESSSMPSRPKVNDEVFSPLQPVTRQTFYIVNILLWIYIHQTRPAPDPPGDDTPPIPPRPSATKKVRYNLSVPYICT